MFFVCFDEQVSNEWNVCHVEVFCVVPTFLVLEGFSYHDTVRFERCSGFGLPVVSENGTGERSSVLGKDWLGSHRVGGGRMVFC